MARSGRLAGVPSPGHLAVCQACREALQEYEAVIDQAIPSIAANEEVENVAPGPGWSQERAENAFFKRLADEEGRDPGGVIHASPFSPDIRQLPPSSNAPTWQQVWLLYAAAILLFVSLGLYAYRVNIGPHIASLWSVSGWRTTDREPGLAMWTYHRRPRMHRSHA